MKRVVTISVQFEPRQPSDGGLQSMWAEERLRQQFDRYMDDKIEAFHSLVKTGDTLGFNVKVDVDLVC